MTTTSSVAGIVSGLAALVVLSAGARASAPTTRSPARSPKPRRASPRGEVTMGPVTTIKTDARGNVVRDTDLTSLSPVELARYRSELARQGISDSSLLTDEQASALESASVEAARAAQPNASATQMERARAAARRAREMMARQPAREDDDERDEATEHEGAIPSLPNPPPTPVNLETARREAPALARHIASKGHNYSRQSVKAFQKHAGLNPDGIYGPLTASALAYFGAPSPRALYKAAEGSPTVYVPV